MLLLLLLHPGREENKQAQAAYVPPRRYGDAGGGANLPPASCNVCLIHSRISGA